MSSAPEVRTARLTLRPLSQQTAQDILAGRHRPDWAAGFPQAGDRAVARAFVAGPLEDGDLGFADPRWGAYEVWTILALCIGTAGFFGPPIDGVVEVGYGIAPGHRGRGLATEAVGALVALARQHGLRSVVARVDPGNSASLAVLERLGFDPVDVGADEIRLVLALRS